jgi:hypothetical protein
MASDASTTSLKAGQSPIGLNLTTLKALILKDIQKKVLYDYCVIFPKNQTIESTK